MPLHATKQFKVTSCNLRIYPLALRDTLCLFRLALQGYSVASLPLALRFHSQSLLSLWLCAFILSRFASSSFALSRVSSFTLTKIFEKNKCISINLKCSETHRNAKKMFTPLTHYAPVLRFSFTEIFEKKCVSIDSKWSETHRNAKKMFTPLTHYALHT